MSHPHDSNYIIEFIQHGKQTKVTAVDPVSMREVSTIVPTHISHEEMMELAVKKLEYVLNKE